MNATKADLRRFMKLEEWRPVMDWEGLYEVSSLGRIRSFERTGIHGRGISTYPSKILKQIKATSNYVVVNLTDNSDPNKPRRRKQVSIHRAVLEAFVGPCPKDMEGCHNNGVRSDCRLSNLRWDTRPNNHADKWLHGTQQTGINNPAAALTAREVRLIRDSSDTHTALANRLGVSRRTIHNCRSGLTYRDVI